MGFKLPDEVIEILNNAEGIKVVATKDEEVIEGGRCKKYGFEEKGGMMTNFEDIVYEKGDRVARITSIFRG